MHIVIAISFATLATIVFVVWLLFNLWLTAVRRRRLARLRAKQEGARLKQMEKALRPKRRWRPFLKD